MVKEACLVKKVRTTPNLLAVRIPVSGISIECSVGACNPKKYIEVYNSWIPSVKTVAYTSDALYNSSTSCFRT